MDLATYIQDPERRAALADSCGTVGEYLYQIATGRRRAGAVLARKIEEATGGAVTCHELRPDVFGPAPERSAA